MSTFELFKKHSRQRTSIADGGGVEKPPPGNRSSIEILLMKIITKSQIDNVQPEPKTNSELQPIAPTSSPTIGNTLVTSRFSSAWTLSLLYFLVCTL